jgi:hypothetical protein
MSAIEYTEFQDSRFHRHNPTLFFFLLVIVVLSFNLVLSWLGKQAI